MKIKLLIFSLLLLSVVRWGQTDPSPFDLSTGSWTLTEWNTTMPPSSYPGNAATELNNTTGVITGVGNGNMMFWKHAAGRSR